MWCDPEEDEEDEDEDEVECEEDWVDSPGPVKLPFKPPFIEFFAYLIECCRNKDEKEILLYLKSEMKDAYYWKYEDLFSIYFGAESDMHRFSKGVKTISLER